MSNIEDGFIEGDYDVNFLGNIRKELNNLRGCDIMALELIQNANDAKASEIRFDICDDELIVYNDKKFSSCGALKGKKCDFGEQKCDFHAIKHIASGNKAREAGNIGRFGIGFVSVYQITDQPVIHSNKTEMVLDPYTPRNLHRDLPEDIDGTYLFLPWAFEHSPTRHELDIKVSKEICDEMFHGAIKAGEESLLFLKHLKTIKILKNGEIVKEFTVKREKNITSVIKKCHISNEIDITKYLVFKDFLNVENSTPDSESSRNAERSEEVQVAVVCAQIESDNSGLVFAHLPTEKNTRMPIHINADFTPDTTRKNINLANGEGASWNQKLLDCSIEVMANNLDNFVLKDKLGYKNFSNFLFLLCRENLEKGLEDFGDIIKEKAMQIKCIYTCKGEWVKPSDALLVSNDLEFSPSEQEIMFDLGLKIVHPDITRIVENTLCNRYINLCSFVEKLQHKKISKYDEKKLQKLYSIVNKLCSLEADYETKERIKEIKFIIGSDKKLKKINDMRRLPPKVKLEDLPRIFPKEIIIDKKFKRKYKELYEIFDDLSFYELGEKLKKINSPSAARKYIGGDTASIKNFYNLLVKYKDEEIEEDENPWESIPFLYAQESFDYAKNVILPSNFILPFSKLKIIDKKYIDDDSSEIKKFFKKAFKLKKLTQKDYIENHLANDIKAKIEEEGTIKEPLYSKMLFELTKGENKILKITGVSALLKEMPLVKNKNGNMKKASDCFFQSPLLVRLFGDDNERWVDKSAIRKNEKLTYNLFKRLGVKTEKKISIDQIEEQIEYIIEEKPNHENRRAVSEILKFLADNKKHEVGVLSEKSWLPAKHNGIIDEENWHKPESLFNPTKNKEFRNHLKVLDINEKSSVFENGKKLLKALGIREQIEIHDYVKIILEIAEKSDENSGYSFEHDEGIYFKCLISISEEINKAEEFIDIVDSLKENRCIRTKSRDFMLPRNVYICNNEELVKSFDGRLDRFIFYYSEHSRQIIHILKKLRIGEIEDPDVLKDIKLFDENAQEPMPEFNELIKGQKFLNVLSWAFYNTGEEYNSIAKEYKNIEECLREINFYSVEDLQIQYKFLSAEGGVLSDELPQDVFFDDKEKIVYVQRGLDDILSDWATIFKAIFSKKILISNNAMILQLAIKAAQIIMGPSVELEVMQRLGFTQPKEFIEFNDEEVDNLEELQDDFEDIKDSATGFQNDYPENQIDNDDVDVSKNSSKGGQATQSYPKDYNRREQHPRNGNSQRMRSDKIRLSTSAVGERDYSSGGHISEEKKNEISTAAVEAVVKHLEDIENFEVKRYPHFQEGFDLTAIRGDEERIIEVKGLEGKWIDKPVSLSPKQILKSHEEKEKFWLYIVECATTAPIVRKMPNPFGRISGFEFDYRYKRFTE